MNLPLPARVGAIGQLVSSLTRAGLIAGLRPDKYVRMAAIVRREGVTATTGISLSAVRCPQRTALIDELGALTWQELADRCDAFATALQKLDGATPRVIGVMCRNHRGFVESLAAVSKIGADIVLLNTAFAGPQLAEVVQREGLDTIIYHDGFGSAVDHALAEDDCRRIRGWVDGPGEEPTIEDMIGARLGQRPEPATRTGKLVLLTSGTTGTPKGARRASGGDVSTLKGVLDRIPWHAEETMVVAAPMFHAWGFGQLLLSATMSCTVVMRRRFDAEETLRMAHENKASALAVVPVMLDRIMELPNDVRAKYPLPHLRFATASGSRMRPDVVTAFMDEFGDVVYNSYNATEAGLIATAVPADLRHDPETAGKPAVGTEVLILDDAGTVVPTGEVGEIFVRNDNQFDGYTAGGTKDFHEGFMASGDLGRLDGDGRLYVVGRADDMIASGGENVYPIEVERTLAAHPAVTEAAVIGVADKAFGQRLEGFVVLHDPTVGPDDLRDHIRAHLAGYKVPRTITVLDELPRNNTGKILKRELVTRFD
ncbi:AMP-binding protein [Gordonia sp. VNQ95]|uniref:AMP-binding protein n=1 Tax=Gordonia sp. VNQ95 TaxID=3156619 RepID=UPI0032B52667